MFVPLIIFALVSGCLITEAMVDYGIGEVIIRGLICVVILIFFLCRIYDYLTDLENSKKTVDGNQVKR